MHPKPLKILCFEELVDKTIIFQLRQNDPKELFREVRKLWDELMGLRQLYKTALALLCAHVLRTRQLSPPQPRDQVHVVSLFPAILTLLAARTTELCLNPAMEQVSGTLYSCLDGTGIFKEINRVQKIDASSVDLGIGTCFFVKLLPCCHNLTVLILDVNVSPSILEAARQCPLNVLHVSERPYMSIRPQLPPEVFSGMVLGTGKKDLRLVLGAYMMGVTLTFMPAWPNLTHLGTGWCKVSREFLLLALLFLPKIEYMHNNYIAMSDVVEEYIRRHQGQESPKVPLKAYMIRFDSFWKHYAFYPHLEHVTLMPLSPVSFNDNSLFGLFLVSNHLPNLTTLRLLTNVLIKCPYLLPEEMSQFHKFRSQVTTLELDAASAAELDASWLMSLLQYFPRLRILFLHGNKVVYTEPGDPVKTCFDSITDVQFVFDNDARFLRLLNAFPNMECLTLTAVKGKITMPWEKLVELRQLRVLNLYAYEVNDLSGLCTLPRSTVQKAIWKLRAAPRLVPRDMVPRLRNAGWTWIPVTDIVTEDKSIPPS